MKLAEKTRKAIWDTGQAVISRIPELTPEIREIISIAQNPIDIDENTIMRTLSDTARILVERYEYTSIITRKKLMDIFNLAAEDYGMDTRCHETPMGIICRGHLLDKDINFFPLDRVYKTQLEQYSSHKMEQKEGK